MKRSEVSQIVLCPFLKGECKKVLCALYREDRKECAVKVLSEVMF